MPIEGLLDEGTQCVQKLGSGSEAFDFKATAGTMDADTSVRQIDSFIITFDRPVDPTTPGGDVELHVSGMFGSEDAFDFKATETGEGDGTTVASMDSFVFENSTSDARPIPVQGWSQVINKALGPASATDQLVADDPANIDDLVINAVISAADQAAGDAFDFKATEAGEVADVGYGNGGDGGFLFGNGGDGLDGVGRDDLATYQPDTVDTHLSFSAVDTGGIPVSLPEYGLFLA